ncbi:MAG: tetratricopeptide repeat protein [Chthoniobacterales bacterium]|nr:tetratricopeptide repeat protein [Chthoniobacterales bacterium]
MSRADDATGPVPSPQPWGWFEPTPAQLREKLTATRARCGEDSVEYAFVLVELGDAHMVQGRLSNPAAQASYETALKIFQTEGQETPEVAWLYDKLANVKQSSGDTFGAEADLKKALALWQDRPPDKLRWALRDDHLTRREEDLERLRKVNAFKNRKPPEL